MICGYHIVTDIHYVNFFIVELTPYDFIHPITDSIQWNEFAVFVSLCIIVMNLSF